MNGVDVESTSGASFASFAKGSFGGVYALFGRRINSSGFSEWNEPMDLYPSLFLFEEKKCFR